VIPETRLPLQAFAIRLNDRLSTCRRSGAKSRANRRLWKLCRVDTGYSGTRLATSEHAVDRSLSVVRIITEAVGSDGKEGRRVAVFRIPLGVSTENCATNYWVA
jgi:hypothetical protein